MINVAVIPGWGGGAWHVRNFIAALKASGYEVTEPARADIIIAHSIACFDLPQKTPAVLYVLIDPPYWPGQSILQRWFKHARSGPGAPAGTTGIKDRLSYYFWCAVYVAAKPKYTWMVLEKSHSLSFLQTLSGKNVWIIRNQDDPFCSPDIQLPIASYKRVNLVDLPGGHEDYYANPQPYIALLPKQI